MKYYLGDSSNAKKENQGFMCENCGLKVQPLNNGSYRNHCPNCLYSLHLDMKPGDRKSSCKGLMKPIDFRQHSKWMANFTSMFKMRKQSILQSV